jgi:CRP-like cAMP-binding protein
MIDAERLREVALFSSLAEADRARLAEWFDDDEAPAGKHLIQEGSAGYAFFVLEQGEVTVTQGGAELARLGPGDVFGEMVFFGGEGRRNAEVVADTPVSLLVMFGTRFRELQQAHPDVAAAVERAAAVRRTNTGGG